MAEFDKDHASVSGDPVHRNKFAYVGDPEDKSTWKLPIHDESHVRNAMARFGQTDLPANQRSDVAHKLVRAAKAHGIDTSGFEEAHLAETRHQLSDVKDGLVRIAIAQTGDYEKDGRPFTISGEDLKSMARHLKEREVPLDYEHLSANPDAPPGHSRASGWITAPDKIEAGPNGSQILYGWAQFTPACLTAIKNREYKYFSPEIHWNEKDQHGKAIGTRLAAGAITNRPFLKDLPPIEIDSKDFPALLEAVALSEHQRLIDVGDVHVPADINSTKGKHMKKFSMKKLAGKKAGIFDGDEQVGMVSADELEELAEDMYADELEELAEFQKCGDLKSLKSKLAEYEELKKGSKKLAETDMAELEELRKMKASTKKDMEELEELRKLKARTQKGGDLYIKHEGDDDDDDQDGQKSMKKLTEVVKTQNANRVAEADRVCLSELAKTEPGEKTELLADDMISRGTLSLAGFRKHGRIEKMLDSAIQKGKVLPKQRQTLYELAVADFDRVQQLLNEAKAVLDLSERGIPGSEATQTATQELDAMIATYRKEHATADYAEALKEVTRLHPELWSRHKEQSQILKEAR